MSEATPNNQPALAPAVPSPVAEGRVSARTLVTIRWAAIVGQAATLAIVMQGLGMHLLLPHALGAVAVSIAVNLFAVRRLRQQPFLADRDAALYLAYDMVQLAVLLYLTGGLDNPFAVMMLAPLTVAASALGRVAVASLTALAVLCFTALALFALPLPWPGQEEAGLPLLYRFGVWAALTLSSGFIAAYLFQVAQGARRLSMALNASQDSLARAHHVSAVGALAAAAAHELGSPLGTIAVVAKELARDIDPASPMAEDVALLQSQVARCRDILAELSRHPGDRGGAEPIVPMPALIETVASPYVRPEIDLVIESLNEPEDGPPSVQSVPEVVHGLANILQNAMQFARSRVRVTIDWAGPGLTLTVADDGPGYPPALLDRLGEPYVSGRSLAAREAAGNMGLGLFIAQSLLERSGASVRYANGKSGGAAVAIRWKTPSFTV